jgi:signal transduction histidine kinase
MKQFMIGLKLFPISINLDKSLRVLSNPHVWFLTILIVLVSIPYHFDFLSFNHRIEWIWQFRFTEYVYHINGSLVYLPFIYAAVVFGWVSALYVWTLSFIIVLPRIIYYTYSFPAFFTNIAILVVPVVTISCVVLVLKWMRRERQIFLDREAERQVYMAEVLKAQENERKNVAHEIHDGTIQTLFVLSNNIQSVLDNGEKPLSADLTRQMELFRDTVSRASVDLRRLCVKLRPSVLDNIGLIESLRWLVDNVNGTSIKARLVINGDYRSLNNNTETMIFRCVQEALNNVKRHSRATEVMVEMSFAGDTTRITILDNGKGFELPKPLSKLAIESKLGLLGMQERAKLLNGTFDIFSQPGEGTAISLEFKS